MFITWRTWAGAHSIDSAIAERLALLLPALAREEQAALLELAIVPDHVHVLVELGNATNLSRLVQRMKGASARIAKRDQWSARILRWEKGYDSRTIGRRALPALCSYFNDQGTRHGVALLARWSGPGIAERSRAITFPLGASAP